MKYFDRDELIETAIISEQRDYNRTVSVEWLHGALAEGAYFPITLAMVHEHIAGKPVEPHMRLMIVINADGDQIVLDVDADIYNSLSSVDVDEQESRIA